MPKLSNLGALREPQEKTLCVSAFQGVDLTSGAANVDLRRSPNAPNMMPGADGFPVKRPGFTTVCALNGAVHGAYSLAANGEEHRLIHAGTRLYRLTQNAAGEIAAAVLADGMADAPSCAVQLGGRLWILDGGTYRCYDGTCVAPVSSIATVPLITIGKAPNGQNGATTYKPVNLLTGRRTDSFLGEANTTAYYLSFQELTPAAVTARVLTAAGAWEEKTEGADFSVDRALGKVTFAVVPGQSPLTGEDNVRITYEVESRAELVNKLRFSILYGVAGALDRVFLSGSPNEPNVDYWSEFSDPAYIGDVNYAQLGQESSPIVGYSVLNNFLVTHKRGEENGRNAFVRAGELDADGNAVFRITGVVQGDGACGTRSFASLNSEPMFLTARGVYALTPNDITGERYAQCRSYYVNGALQKLTNAQREAACACVWGRFYVLAAGGKLYLLDGDRKTYESRSPYASFQYECWAWEVEAAAVWQQDGALWAGGADGRVRRLAPGAHAADYADDGVPYAAAWSTPLSNLGVWSNTKTVTGVWVACQPYARSSAAIRYATDREAFVDAGARTIDIFSFDDVDFQRFTFNTLDRPAVIAARKKARRAKLFAVRVENAAREPFGLLAVQINFRTGGKAR